MKFPNTNSRFIYRTTAQRAPSSGESSELDADLLGDVNSAKVSEQNKQQMRQYVASGDSAKNDLVRRFLEGEIRSERELEEQIYSLSTQEKSITLISGIQRKISTKILNTLEDVEMYQELVPYQRKQFDRSLGALKKLNGMDSRTDTQLKKNIKSLINPPKKSVGAGTPPANIFASPSADDIKAIYANDPRTDEYKEAFARVKATLDAAHTVAPFTGTALEEDVRETAQKILTEITQSKNDEVKLDNQFRRVVKEVDRIILNSLDKAKNIVHEESIIEAASNACGVTLEDGIEIKTIAPDPTSLTPTRVPCNYTITEVKVLQQDVTDDTGKKVGKRFGTVMITVKDSAGAEVSMTMGRFKKWLDATEGFELVEDVPELERKTLLSEFGIDIKPDMQLSYVQGKREKDGSISRSASFVAIKSIKDNRVTFTQPVQYAPGFEDIDYAEMKSSLELGEFLKWWRRSDVEQSMDIILLRKRLQSWQKLHNKKYKEKNKAIAVVVDEELMYPDDSRYQFRIKHISDDGITLDNGELKSFNEFYSWVNRNHVTVKPPDKKSDEECKKAFENKAFAEMQKKDDKHIIHEKEHLAEQLTKNAVDYLTDRKSVSLWDKVKTKWYSTQVLSLTDVGNMYKEISEFVKRRHERKSKGRYSQVGERLPGLIGVDFERAKEDAEHEEVGKYQHAMEHWGIDTLRHVLYTTNDKDVCKAVIIVLVGKGEMRFDDPMFWETINRISFKFTTRGGELRIPAPHQYAPRQSYEEPLEKAIDILWAKRQYIDWNNENKSKYNSNVSTFEAKFKELSADPKGIGGPAGELKLLLERHLTTEEYVNPHLYESVIEGAIKNGKMGAEEKMFYLIAGLTAVNHKRHPPLPILSYERVGELNSKYLAQFPLMDFFTEELVVDPFLPKKPDGSYATRKQKMEDFQEYVDRYFRSEVYGKLDDNGKQVGFKPGPSFSRFMWEKMLPSDSVRTRISKGLRSAENMDHDDAHMYIPPATYEEIKRLCGPSTGNKAYFTPEGYANGYPGFNQWIITLANVIEEDTDETSRLKKVDTLQDAFNSFVIFDLILSNSIYKDDKQLARLDAHHYRRPAVTDGSINMGMHQAQLRHLILELAKEYGYADQFAFLYSTKIGSVSDPKEKAKHDDYKTKVEGLKETIAKMMSEDKGKKALAVIRRLQTNNADTAQGLRGIKDSTRPDLKVLTDQRKEAMKAIAERMHSQGAGGHH